MGARYCRATLTTSTTSASDSDKNDRVRRLIGNPSQRVRVLLPQGFARLQPLAEPLPKNRNRRRRIRAAPPDYAMTPNAPTAPPLPSNQHALRAAPNLRTTVTRSTIAIRAGEGCLLRSSNPIVTTQLSPSSNAQIRTPRAHATENRCSLIWLTNQLGHSCHTQGPL